MSAWKVSQASTLPNQVFKALTRIDSGSSFVTLLIAARSVRGTPRKCSMTNILHMPAMTWETSALQKAEAGLTQDMLMPFVPAPGDAVMVLPCCNSYPMVIASSDRSLAAG